MNGINSVSRRLYILTICIAALCGSVNAFAQSSSAALEEIVVTAERRTQNLQNVALSATVLTGDMLEDKGVGDLYQIQYAAPSVTIAHFGSANEFNIRGIGRTQVDIDVPSGIVIYRDGAPTIAGYFQTEPYFDIKSIEVLRGPQGTFVGKSAAGGAVFITTNEPDLEAFSGSVQGGYGNNDTKEFTGVVNIPVNDTLGVRASFNHLDSDDFYDHITGTFTGHPGERDLNSVRGSVLWEPNSKFSALVKVDYHDLDFGGNVVSSPGFPLYTVEQNGELAYKDKSTRVVGELNYTFDNGVKLRSSSAFQNLDSVNNLDLNGSLPLFYQFKSAFNVQIVSQEINLISSEDQRLRWVLGFLYYEQDARVPYWDHDGFTFTGGGFGLDFPWLTSPWFKHEDEWSMFGHVAYDITDKLEIEGGIRYSDYYTDQVTNWQLGFGTAPPVLSYTNLFFGFPAGELKQKLRDDSVDGQVALNYTIDDDNFVYGLFSRGHITGGINIFPPFRIYDEEQVFNYEAGWKADWMNDQVRTQADFFYEDFDHYQVNFEQLAAFGAPGQDNRNAPGDSTVWGFEFSSQAHVDNWHIDFAFAYMDSDIGKFQGVVNPFTTQVVDLSGRRTPYSPHVTTNGGVAYDFALTGALAGYTLTPRIDVSYVSDTQSKLWDTPLVTIPERTIANVQVVLDAPSDKWSATFWMTNAFDERYVAGIQNLASLYYAGRPQEFGLRLKYNF